MKAVKTVFLLALLSAIFLVVGYLLAGVPGLIVAFVVALGMNFFSYWFSDKVVLRMYRAQKVSDVEAPRLVQQVRTQAQQAGLPMPRVYIIPTASPNAFATVRNPKHAAVACTQGRL